MKLDGFGIFVEDMPTTVKFYRDYRTVGAENLLYRRPRGEFN